MTLTSADLQRKLRAALEEERAAADLSYYYEGDRDLKEKYEGAQKRTNGLVDLVNLDAQNLD
jgi:hypothetical protein